MTESSKPIYIANNKLQPHCKRILATMKSIFLKISISADKCFLSRRQRSKCHVLTSASGYRIYINCPFVAYAAGSGPRLHLELKNTERDPQPRTHFRPLTPRQHCLLADVNHRESTSVADPPTLPSFATFSLDFKRLLHRGNKKKGQSYSRSYLHQILMA